MDTNQGIQITDSGSTVTSMISNCVSFDTTEDYEAWKLTSEGIEWERHRLQGVAERRQNLKERVFYWISRNRRMDAVDVADHFGITVKAAVDVTGELLSEGLLDFD